MPICKKCNQKFPNSIYVDGVRKKTDTRLYCLDCSPYKSYRRKGTGKYKTQAKERFLKNYYITRTSRKEELVKLKGGKCSKCNYNKSLSALSFHHRDPKEKLFGLSKEALWKYSWDKIISEVNKCDLLCLNCHAELHEEENKKHETV